MLECRLTDRVGDRWTGVLAVTERLAHDRWQCTQVLTQDLGVLACSLDEGVQKVTIYGALVTMEDGGIVLRTDECTKFVVINDGPRIPKKLKTCVVGWPA